MCALHFSKDEGGCLSSCVIPVFPNSAEQGSVALPGKTRSAQRYGVGDDAVPGVP